MATGDFEIEELAFDVLGDGAMGGSIKIEDREFLYEYHQNDLDYWEAQVYERGTRRVYRVVHQRQYQAGEGCVDLLMQCVNESNALRQLEEMQAVIERDWAEFQPSRTLSERVIELLWEYKSIQ